MGFYYGPSSTDPEPQEKPPGCMDVIIITRAMFAVLFWPLLALLLLIFDLALIFYAFAVHPALALVPIGLTVGAVALFARWDRNRGYPSDLHE
jgi:hypothetical protein